MTARWITPVAALLLLLPGCKKDTPAAGPKAGVAGVQWAVPARWASKGERPFRVATYTVPAAQGDAEPAECGVSYFGADQGGAIDMNIDRWISQFEPTSAPGRSTKEVSGMKVTLVQIAGAYLAPAGPMMAPTGKKENFRLLGAIVEGPQGSVFFKLTGPASTVGAAEQEFDALIGSLSK
jgi:hypothetical protein